MSFKKVTSLLSNLRRFSIILPHKSVNNCFFAMNKSSFTSSDIAQQKSDSCSQSAKQISSESETEAESNVFVTDGVPCDVTGDSRVDLNCAESLTKQHEKVSIVKDTTESCNSNMQSEAERKSKNMMKRDVRRALSYKRRQGVIKDVKKRRIEEAIKKKEENIPDDLESLHVSQMNETEYYFENGLRKVRPYYFTFNTHAKGRWLGRTVYDVFSTEFFTHSKTHVDDLLKEGRIKVNGDVASRDDVLRNGDVVSNRSHRHEVPVAHSDIEIIADTADVLVVNKPASLPMHPCGRYRYNTLTYILAKEYGYTTLRSTYRLDRLTSGVVIFGKDWLKTKELSEIIRERKVEKEYLAKVAGKFPDTPTECTEPMTTLIHMLGVHHVTKAGKPAHTTFELVSYDEASDTSIVKCRPITGRTHQIRVHLQYLGYPIANDPLYNTAVWGPNKGKGGDYGGLTIEQLCENLPKYHDKNLYVVEDNSSPATLSGTANSTDSKDASSEGVHVEAKASSTGNATDIDPLCEDCHKVYRDPTPDELCIYLHCLCHKGPSWEYTTSIPKWAT